MASFSDAERKEIERIVYEMTQTGRLQTGGGSVSPADVTAAVNSVLDANAVYLNETSFTGSGTQASPLTGKAGRGFTPRGEWAPSTVYNADDLVTNTGRTFRVTTTFQSGSSFSTTNLELWADKGTDGSALGPDYALFPTMLLETDMVAFGTANISLTSGSAYTRKITAVKTGTATSVQFRVSTAGATLTAGAANNSIAVYDATGATRLGIADCNTAFTTTGDKSVAFDTSVSLVSGTTYIISVVSTGTTPAILVGTAGSNIFNLGQAVAPFNHARVTTGGNGTSMALTGGSVVDARGSGRIFVALF